MSRAPLSRRRVRATSPLSLKGGAGFGNLLKEKASEPRAASGRARAGAGGGLSKAAAKTPHLRIKKLLQVRSTHTAARRALLPIRSRGWGRLKKRMTHTWGGGGVGRADEGVAECCEALMVRNFSSGDVR